MKRLFKEPLVQFVVAGAVLFLITHYFSQNQTGNTSAYEITVNDETLMQYLQSQTKSFGTGGLRQYFSDLPNHEKKILTDDFIRDEALFREAISLGLDDNDEVIRRRLIQKMEYIAQGFYNELPGLGEADLTAYFQQHKETYRIAASVSFTHVFFSAKKHGGAEACVEPAKQQLVKLNKNQVPFEDASLFGDRYIYSRNYIDRTRDFISSHFGEDFQQVLFKLRAGNKWQGPFQSDYGAHLVLLKKKTPSRLPELSEVAQMVLSDVQRDQQLAMKREAITALVNKYTIIETSYNR